MVECQTNIDLQVSVISAALFAAFSIGTALAPNLASFFVFRILTAFQGTAFLVVGSAVIGDIYKPVSNTTFTTEGYVLYTSASGQCKMFSSVSDLGDIIRHCNCSR